MRLATWIALGVVIGLVVLPVATAIGLWALSLYGQVLTALAGVVR